MLCCFRVVYSLMNFDSFPLPLLDLISFPISLLTSASVVCM
jgi:hypothetical protein